MNLWTKFRALFRKQKLDAEMAEELRVHLELQAAENEKRGMARDEARYAALRAFGGVEQIKERVRDQRTFVWVEQVRQDFRHAMRALARQRGFTLVAMGTLALGLGVNAALFSVFNAVALRPLPLKHPDQLVDVSGRHKTWGGVLGFSYLDYLDLRAGQRSLAGLAAWMEMTAAMDANDVHAPAFVESRNVAGNTARVPVQFVSDNFFAVLGAEVILGRGFRPEETARPGAAPVIVLQHQFWLQQFQGDAAVLGKTITLRDVPVTIIGVAAPEFVGKMPAPPIGWMPVVMLNAINPAKRENVLADRHSTRFHLVARLQPDVARETARAELEVVARRIAQSFPDDHSKEGIVFQDSGTFMSLPLNIRTLIGTLPIWLGFALVLLVACANVANLLLARATTRQQEIGVRLALGASRGRILRHLLAESMLIALGGGAAGLLVATWFLQAVRPPLIAMLPPVNRGVRDWLFLNLTPDYRVFAFMLLLAFVAALAAGLFPAWQAARSDVNAALKNDGQSFSRRSRLRHGLVVLQVAICLTLLAVTVLLVRHVLRFATIETGLRPERVYNANFSLLSANIAGSDRASQRPAEAAQMPSARVRQAIEAVRALPGIDAVAQAYRYPFTGRMRLTPIAAIGGADDDTQLAKFNLVSAEFFSTVGLGLTRGRAFDAHEVATRAAVVVVSETAAERLWPGKNPLGQRLRVSSVAFDGGWSDPRQRQQQNEGVFSSFEVIGVARDTRSGWVWERDDTMLYLPLPPDSALGPRTLVKLSGPKEQALPLAWSAAAARGVPVRVNVQNSLEEERNIQLLPFKGVAAAGVLLGTMALLMAVVGLYGVMAFVVGQRVREIGIRMALGATAQAVVGLFVLQGMRLVLIGIVIGGVGGTLVAVTIAKFVVGVRAFDPIALGSVALLLTGATVAACWLPARRATKIDPMVALRAE